MAKSRMVYGIGLNDADYQVRKCKIVGYKDDGRKIQKIYGHAPSIRYG